MKATSNQTKPTLVEQKKRVLKDEGNIKPEILNEIIVNKKGKPDYLAIDIYVEVRSWFKPKKTVVNGNVVYSSKLKGHGFQIGYEYFVKKHKCTSETIRTKLALLEELGLLTREFRTEYFKGKRFNNLMYLFVWKDTPHFYSEIGLEKPKKSSSSYPENQGHLSQNFCPPIQKNLDNIYVIPNNQPKEIPPSYAKGGISVSSILETETNTHARDPVQKNQQQKPATFAPCSLTEPEQLASIPKKQVEPNQSVTNCSQLTSQQEKAIEQKRKTRSEENTGLVSMSDLMAKVLNESTKQEEILEMNLEDLPQITDKQERAILLSRTLQQTFGEERSGEIQDDYKFVEIHEHKVCIQAREMQLNDIEKAKIRKAIASIYGEDVILAMQIVVPATEKPTPGNENELVNSLSTRRTATWLDFKATIKTNSMITMLTNPVLKTIEIPGKVIIETVPFLIDRLTSPGYLDELERSVLETGLTLELRVSNTHPEYKNFNKEAIVISPGKILKDMEFRETCKPLVLSEILEEAKRNREEK